ncbi:hypothetical protein LINPERHAP1_LOCUS138 [Linum perenne]
MNTLLVLLTI